MKTVHFLVLTFCALLLVTGCSSPKGDTAAERVDYIDQMAQQALEDLYAQRPEMRERIAQAPGYGVFSNIGTMIVFVGTEGGFGVVTDNATGDKTYMKMGGLKGGFGIGLKDFRGVFVFNDPQALNRFVDNGWEFGAEAGAAAESGQKGGSASARGSFAPIEVYQITQSGIIAQASVGGTKYWKDNDLNVAALKAKMNK